MKSLTQVTRLIAISGILISTGLVAQPPERDGDRPGFGRDRGPRDGEGGPRGGPRDGEEGRRGGGPRDGGPREGGPRDGGPEGRGPRDGGPEGRGPGGPGGMDPARMMQMFPVMAALDANKDGELSVDEIAGAVAALKKVDKNNDGRIDISEMRPDFRGGGSFGGGRGGPPGGGFGGPPPREGDRDMRGERDGRGRPDGEGRSGFGGGRPQSGEDMVERLMKLDANGDKELSKDELPERFQAMLDRIDTDNSGTVSESEVKAMAERFNGGRPGQGGGGQRGRRGGDEGGRAGGDLPKRPASDSDEA